jgi:hypothetical protein
MEQVAIMVGFWNAGRVLSGILVGDFSQHNDWGNFNPFCAAPFERRRSFGVANHQIDVPLLGDLCASLAGAHRQRFVTATREQGTQNIAVFARWIDD